ncbi:MAG TPA: hypothetical protein VK492_09825 [Chitinophagaceae bacterium]|nr:hypothetical protein [Chitinophagaceae bacterium]
MNAKSFTTLNKIFLTTIVCFTFLFSSGQRIYIDTVTYEGTIKIKNDNFRYKRIKSVVENLKNNFKVYDPELSNPEDETLLIFDKTNKCILNFKLNEVEADHNNATIMETECYVTDSSLKLTRYNYWWASYDVGYPVGIEHYEYCINNSGALYLKDSSSVFSDNSKQKLKISKSDNIKFREIIKKAFTKEVDRQKMYEFLD